jgi:molybdenum cofactor cytidylyltransferase
MRISTLILAAGSSSRLGRPKQILRFEGQTLIERIAQVALEVTDYVLVVLGANEAEISPHLELLLSTHPKQFDSVINSKWKDGIGSTLSFGVQKLAEASDAILILLSDQPFVDEVLLRKILQGFAENKSPIVACSYANQLGVPILIGKQFFEELILLQRDKGAKEILNKHIGKVLSIDFPDGILDVDTERDAQQLKLL